MEYFGGDSYIQPTYWKHAATSMYVGMPGVIIGGILCMIFLFEPGLRKEYQNSVTFTVFCCFCLGSPIALYNAMVFIGMAITGGNFHFSVLSCSLLKMFGLSTWYCSFLVPNVVAFNRYLEINRGYRVSWRKSVFFLFIAFCPLLSLDILNFLIGVPTANDTCSVLILADMLWSFYNGYVWTICFVGVVLHVIVYLNTRRRNWRSGERRLLITLSIQTSIPLLATTFFSIAHFGALTHWFETPTYFSVPANLLALLSSTLLVPLVAVFFVTKARNAVLRHTVRLLCINTHKGSGGMWTTTVNLKLMARKRSMSLGRMNHAIREEHVDAAIPLDRIPDAQVVSAWPKTPAEVQQPPDVAP